eukprot:3655060-Prymnesium_polylepis.1
MAATSERGETGFLRSSDLRFLLRRANASPAMASTDLSKAIEAAEQSMQSKLPEWLRADAGSLIGGGSKPMDAPLLAEML